MSGFRLHAWQSDNGDGTFTNPLFYDEFSDPDIIRVGDDFLFHRHNDARHARPASAALKGFGELGIPRLRARQAGSRTGVSPGKWKVSLWARHLGTELPLPQRNVYIFSNVNGRHTQLFTATNPAGPWQHTELKHSFHDLSVLFDDDGKIHVVWGYEDIHLAQLTDDLKDIVPGTERVLFAKRCRHGRRLALLQNQRQILHHQRAWWDGRMRLACARADKPEGPYEVNPAISTDESFRPGIWLSTAQRTRRAAFRGESAGYD